MVAVKNFPYFSLTLLIRPDVTDIVLSVVSDSQSEKMGIKMYHGSRNEFGFFPAICFTSSQSSAAAYGSIVTEVAVDDAALSICHVEMSDDELREAIDSQEWPCDRESQIEEMIAAGYDAVRYLDCDEAGRTHDCIRILTADAFARAVTIH